MNDLLDWDANYATGESRMRVAVELARQNVRQGTGGPFGAAIFEASSGRLLSAGVNSVVRLNNSVVHAEMLAIMLAEQQIGSYTLSGLSAASYELVTSCDPCAMCLGAVLWSGLRRMVTGADRADATALSFDEGPVFPESYAYLQARGISITRGVLREEAAAVLELYRRQGGPIYNA
jgi:tRNA(Arg) A34 adenosine deaminase TadA